jgi:hypothetical protein
MKRVILLMIIVALGVFTAYKLLSKKEIKTEEKKQAALIISKNSDAFNESFTRLMNDYYALQQAFVEWDTVKVNEAAGALQQSADNLQLKELKADSSIIQTAQSLSGSISSELKGLKGEGSIEQKRRAFNMLTDEMYGLVRTVRYDRETIYHIKCPMAFNDSEEAYWLSNSNKIVNPYLGKKHPTYKNKMLGCGEVTDSLNFAGK